MQNPTQSLVLVADDDVEERSLICEALRADGFAVSEAENGQQALQKVALERPALVLMDVIMPRMDGFTACATLRATPEGEHIPVIMVTGLDDLTSVEWAYRFGATDFITKPINWLVLQHRVRYVLRSSQLFESLQRSEVNQRALVNAIPDTMIRFDRNGAIVDVKAASSCQPPLADLSQNGLKLLPVPVRQKFVTALEQALLTQTVQLFDCTLIAHGRLNECEVRIVAIAEDQAVAIIRDISEHKRTGERLHTLSHAVEQSPVAVVIADVAGHAEYVNPRFTQMTGYAAEEVLGTRTPLLNPQVLSPETIEHIWRTVKQGDVWRGEYSTVRKNGEIFWESAQISAIRHGDGAIAYLIGLKEDVTEHKVAQDRIRFLAYHDQLTRLPNRVCFQERLDQSLVLAQRHQQPVAVLLLDLDHFKRINDFFGHRVGDGLLQLISERLKTCLRNAARDADSDAHVASRDMLARLEGDEFSVLLGITKGPWDAEQVSKRILETLSAPYDVEGVEIFMSASVGIAVFPHDGGNAETLLKHANTALNHAKQQGRNTHRFYSAWMDAASAQRLSLENQLRRALKREEFSLYYQPQVKLDGGQVVGAEALLRWRNPQLGIVAPAEFIPLAEDLGLINAIGEWVLHTACAQNYAWQAMGLPPISVAVNLSKQQLHNRSLLLMIADALGQTGLAPEGLELELTESMLMQDPDITAQILAKIRHLGVRIAMDDFGTGYSCLSYLMQLPLDTLKIDRSFLANLAENTRKAAIVRTIIALARHLKLQVVAEGVEWQQQINFLDQEGCDMVQGYLTGPPLNAEKFGELLARTHIDSEFNRIVAFSRN